MEEIVKISKTEYTDMMDYIDRLQETLDILSNEKTIKKLTTAMNRINSGEYLTKEEMI